MSVVIAPGTFIDAAEKNIKALQARLTDGSAWMELIENTDDPTRGNSPYYGPATQFIVDCFFDIAEQTPALAKTTTTPLERYRTADYVIHGYIGQFAVGAGGIISTVYENSDIAQTRVHRNRRNYLANDRNHVLLGASVPFDDMARLAGGVALKLDDLGINHDKIADTVVESKGLYIVGGVHGDKTPILTDILGSNYFDPKYFAVDENGLVFFTDEALQVIRTILSPVGCPSSQIKEGETNTFTTYWGKIGHYLLDGVNYSNMRQELASQKMPRNMTIVIPPSSEIQPMQKVQRKPKVQASKRYTPPKK